ncbi:MAG: hypothetical protein U0R21_07455 [Nocardioidaceae bacterium]
MTTLPRHIPIPQGSLMMPRKRLVASSLVGLALTLTLTACGDNGNSASTTPKTSPTAMPTHRTAMPTHRVEQVRVASGKITPEGKIVQLKVNQLLKLEITADQPGELHVHSSPDQTISYPSGQSSWQLEIPRPGVVEIEDHHSGALVFKLQVR